MAKMTFSSYNPAMLPFRVHILVLEDCTALVPVGLADLFRKSMLLPGRPGRTLEVSLVSSGTTKAARGAGAVRLGCDLSFRQVRSSDLVLVPPLDPDVLEHLNRHRHLLPWLKGLHARGAALASACTGSFLLAEAGLLDRKSATTHWAFQDLFRERYPRVRLRPEAVLVDQGQLVTAGGATSFLNLALFLIERTLGAETARLASKMFLVDPNKSPQSAYALFSGQKSHGDDAILRAQEILETDPASHADVASLARQVSLSPRQFARRFLQATGSPPSAYARKVKVEAAKRLFETTRRSVAAVAGQVGYSDLVAFRRAFVRACGLTPSDYRLRYGVATPPLVPRRKGA